MAVAIGDTLGHPFEGKLRSDIYSYFDDFEDFVQNNERLFNTYTDDTQLTIYTAEALIQGGEFNYNFFQKSIRIFNYFTSSYSYLKIKKTWSPTLTLKPINTLLKKINKIIIKDDLMVIIYKIIYKKGFIFLLYRVISM